MLDYIPLKQLISLEIDVSERINSKNLKDFILSSFELNNITYNQNDFVYVNYLSELNQYQIIIIDCKYKNAIFQTFELLYSQNDKTSIESFDLYLCKDFFCIYKNAQFYYYQNIKLNLPVEEFISFINKKFNIKIDNFREFNKQELEELKQSYLEKNKKSSLKRVNLKNNYTFIYYLIYLFLLTFIFIYFYINERNQILFQKTDDEKSLNIEQFKESITFKSIRNDYKNLLEKINNYHLKIVLFEYKSSVFKIVLNSKIKNDLYSFFNEYKKDLISSNINYIEDKNLYEAVVHVRFSK
uniref:hypothetical protein n=1 Tax=Aliarcobacter sp. TaxID=2321116 RepID=UPI004047EBBE